MAYFNADQTKQTIEKEIRDYQAQIQTLTTLINLPESFWQEVSLNKNGTHVLWNRFFDKLKEALNLHNVRVYQGNVDSWRFFSGSGINNVDVVFYESDRKDWFSFDAESRVTVNIDKIYVTLGKYFNNYEEAVNKKLNILVNFAAEKIKLDAKLKEIEEYNKTAPYGFKIHVDYIY